MHLKLIEIKMTLSNLQTFFQLRFATLGVIFFILSTVQVVLILTVLLDAVTKNLRKTFYRTFLLLLKKQHTLLRTFQNRYRQWKLI